MKLKTIPYKEQIKEWPTEGHHIMAQYDENRIVVYQSYRPEIGLFAEKNQYFGGAFSYERMTWIKPNFLWMMFRNGWGQKEGQETVLAIHLKMEAFIKYLKEAEYSSFDKSPLKNHEEWKERIKTTSCRLQWDPDHDPFGAKLSRRAIQIGIRNEYVKEFAKDDIIEIENITDFVNEQYQHIKNNELTKLLTPFETPLRFDNEDLNKKLKI